MCLAGANGDIKSVAWKPASRTAICVVMASDGYPGPYGKGVPINGLDEVGNMDDVIVWDVYDEQTDILLVTLNRLSGSDELARKIALLKRLTEKTNKRICFP